MRLPAFDTALRDFTASADLTRSERVTRELYARLGREFGVPAGQLSVAQLTDWLRDNAPVSVNQAAFLLWNHQGLAAQAIADAVRQPDGAAPVAPSTVAAVIGLMWGVAAYHPNSLTKADWIEVAAACGNPGVGGTVAERRYMKSKTLYRGCGVDDEPGMSWTQVKWRASIFAFKRQKGHLLTARVRPSAVLFVTRPLCAGSDCAWRAVVVDPDQITAEVAATEPGPGLWPEPAPRHRECYCGPGEF